MPTDPSSDLLQPSLGEQAAPRRSPYSTQAHFLSAFFGGPFAALAMSGINAARLDRLRRDAWWIGLLALGCVAFEFWLRRGAGGGALVAWAVEHLGARGAEYLRRALALALFAVGLMVHRREQKLTDLMGLARPSGWIVGIALILGGWLFAALLARALS